MKKIPIFLFVTALVLCSVGCNGDSATVTVTTEPAATPTPSATAAPTATPTSSQSDTTAPVPSSATLSANIDGVWSHLNIVIPYATDETTARSALTYEVRIAPNSSTSISTVSNAVANAGIIKEVTMGANDTSKTVELSVVSGAMYAVAVTVKDAAGNRALYTPIVNTSVPNWQSSLTSAQSFDSVNDSATSGAPPGARLGHEMVYFLSRFYVLMGTDNVSNFPSNPVSYRSAANEFWTTPTQTAPSGNDEFLKRAFFGAVSHTHGGTEKIYVGGGEGFSTARHSDILSSTDGETWSVVASSAPFLPRSDFEFVSHDGSLFAIGGESYTSGTYSYHNDIWKSTNGGVSWTQVNAGTRFAARKDFSAFSLKSCLWVVGGRAVVSGSAVHYRDVWKSCDSGLTWTETQSAAPFAARGVKAASIKKGLTAPGVVENEIEMMCAFGGRNGSTDDSGFYCSYDGTVWFSYKSNSGNQRNDHTFAAGDGYFSLFGGTDSTFGGPPSGYPTFGSLLRP